MGGALVGVDVVGVCDVGWREGVPVGCSVCVSVDIVGYADGVIVSTGVGDSVVLLVATEAILGTNVG